MRKKILLLVVILVAFCQMQTFAQQKVTGRVVGANNEPVAGATVNVSGTTQGTVTDDNGNFSLSVPAGASLLISSVNFKDQVVKVDGRSVINVSLVDGNSSGLEEVVVTGYTAEKKKDIIGSVAIVDMKAAKAVPSGTALSAIQGQAAGVNIVNNGAPGAQSSILIRGVTGFANQPLILVDGIQFTNINDIPPAIDVESIQVLKDGSAAIYGARGGNGVIIVTTKKGKSGAPSVVYDSYYNVQFPKSIDKMNLLSTQQYVDLLTKVDPTQADPATGLFPNGELPDYLFRAGANRGNIRGVAFEGDPRVAANLYNLDPKNNDNNYIISKVYKGGGSPLWDALMNPALMMQQNVTASGGTDRATYLLSLGYLDHKGTLNNTRLRRYTARINTTFKLTNNIRIGENVNLMYRNNPTFPVNGGFGPIEMALQAPTYLPLYDIAGNYAGAYAGVKDQVGDYGNQFARTETIGNNRSRNYTVQGNLFLEVDFLKNFTFRSSGGGNADNFYSQTYTPRQYWNRDGAGQDRLEESAGFSSSLQWTNTLNFKKQFGDHNFNALAGIEAIKYENRKLYSYADNFILDNYYYLVLNQGRTRFPGDNITGSEQAQVALPSDALYSRFGQLNYNFKERYYFGGTFRRDNFSRFGANKNAGDFFSVALGWRISQEAFMRNVAWINDLKLRASYGEMGSKENVRAGNAFSTYAQNPGYTFYAIGGGNTLAQGFSPLTFGNPNTSWESDNLTNIGFDATLFNNHLDLSVEYYKKKLEGLLRRSNLPFILGEGTSPDVNFGDIQNTGIDISATYRARVSRDVNISVGANFTTYKNEIVKMPEPGYYQEGNFRFEEGHPMSSLYGYKIKGIFREQKDLDGVVQQAEALGRWMYEDLDGNDTINDNDRTFIGNPNPKFTLGVNLGATWKNFDFSAVLYAAVGQDVWNSIGMKLSSWEQGTSNKNTRVLDAWSVNNPNGTYKISELSKNFSNSDVMNDAFIEKGSFLRLRNIQVGVTIPGSKLGKTGFTRLRFYVGGTNLFVITKYSGIDPEVFESGVAFRGQDQGANVQQAGIIGGLQLGF
jgi:TonB-dependent starch-binding outer membrane protein SusC